MKFLNKATAMISVMRKHIVKTVTLTFLLQLIFNISYAQEATLISPYMQLQYFKNTDNQSYIQVTLTYSANRMELPLPRMKITFFSVAGEKKLLATSTTDENGVARFAIIDIIKVPVNGDGLWSFITEFEGNDTIEAANAELAVKDVILEMTVSEADSIKTITLNATTMDNGRKVPVAGETLVIYVPRMFSLLPVTEATLDENGTISVEFPSDLPGDSLGNLTIIARFEENPTYGNVEKSTLLKWGIPTSYSLPRIHRALWTKTPPMWMIVTLSILLVGVWGHYLFAVISLILIKIDASKQKAKEEYRL